jgi:Lrp/AsnC family transcriptional regulator, leucine-responsive regulatory protein
MDVDTTDRKILNILQDNARISNADLAEQINLSPSACLRRVRLLEERGIIDGYATLVNQQAIGRPTSVFVEVSLDDQSEESLKAFEVAVSLLPDVMECHLMSGDADYLLRVVAADTADFERVHKILGQLPKLARTRSSFVLRTISKRTAFEL